MKKVSVFVCAVLFAIAPLWATAGEPEVSAHAVSGGVEWIISGFDYGLAYLSVTGPGLRAESFKFGRFERPSFVVDGAAPSGAYRWNLTLRSHLSEEQLEQVTAARRAGDDSFVDGLEAKGVLRSFRFSGVFEQRGGEVLLSDGGAEEDRRDDPGLSKGADRPHKDQVIADDLIVTGSGCFGSDCMDGEDFSGAAFVLLKSNNTRVRFDDTSSDPVFAATDWQLRANSDLTGGDAFFALDELTSDTVPVLVEAEAPTDALRIDSAGRVGFKTADPAADLHVTTGNSPTLRLEQDGSSGFAAQTWEVKGNETSLAVVDVTNGGTRPLRIQPGAPNNAFTIDDSGDVIFGVSATPKGRLDVRASTGTNADMIYLENDGKTTIRMNNTGAGSTWDFSNDGNFNISKVGSGVNEMSLNGTGTLTIRGSLFALGGDGSLDPGDVFPDYVFAPEYELMSIEDLEAFVTSNHHLPNIPSAADVSAAGGINMTELQLRLLEKVEELTLYTIAQQETLDGQDATIEAQADVIRRLTERLDALQID